MGRGGIVRRLLPWVSATVVATWLAVAWTPTKRPGGAERSAVTGPGVERVVIGGREFFLEVAADPESRDRGLSGRASIAADGGMVFVFPAEEWQEFVMRDCPVAIDLLYLDSKNRVAAMHEMQPEEPRGDDEAADGGPGDFRYTARLTPYVSGFPCAIAIEVRGGTGDELGVRIGDHVVLDARSLRARAR